MKKVMFNKYKDLWNGTLVQFIEIIFDTAIVFCALVFGIQIDYLIENGVWYSWGDLLFRTSDVGVQNIVEIIAYVVVVIIFLRIYKVSVVKKKFRSIIMLTILSLLFSNVVLLVIVAISARSDYYLMKNLYSPLIVFGIQLFSILIFKYVFNRIFLHFNVRTIMIYGKKDEVINLAKKFLVDKSKFVKLKYLIFDESIDEDLLNCEFIDYLHDVNDIYVTANISENRKSILINYVLQKTYLGLYFVPQTHEIDIQKTTYDTIDDMILFRAKSMHLSFEQRFVKRVIDILVSSLGIIIAGLPMIVVAIAIKLQDGGKVFFKQERIKRNNKSFEVYKFRSMKENADKNTLAQVNDSRITKVGKIIRATRLDELPQLFNVLKGEMSLVGPRPLIPKVIEETVREHPEFMYRSNVKPGVTGLAQVNGRYDTADIEKLRYDLTYVRNFSFWLDFKIILQTAAIIFNRNAAKGTEKETSFEEIIISQKKRVSEMNYGYEIVDHDDGIAKK